MPKQKSNRAAAKRFSVTGTGKAKGGHANLRHGMISNAYEPALQRARLVAEGVAVDEADHIDLGRYLWDGA